MTATEAKWLAVAGANSAAEATVELIRYVREGPSRDDPALDNEVIEKLADATKMAIDVEREHNAIDAEREELHASLCTYLEGWA